MRDQKIDEHIEAISEDISIPTVMLADSYYLRHYRQKQEQTETS